MGGRVLVGLLVGLVGVGGAVVMVGQLSPRPRGGAGAPGPAAPAAPGVPLQVSGAAPVGLASSIPDARPFDAGAVDFSRNPAGWDFAPIGRGVRA